jgi:hypothetical protein
LQQSARPYRTAKTPKIEARRLPVFLLPGRSPGGADGERHKRLTGQDAQLKEPRVMVAEDVARLDRARYEIEWNEEHRSNGAARRQRRINTLSRISPNFARRIPRNRAGRRINYLLNLIESHRPGHREAPDLNIRHGLRDQHAARVQAHALRFPG